MKTSITIDINTDALDDYSDEHIAQLWHIAQANPAPLGTPEASDLVEEIGREIIKRWLKTAPTPLWNHQGKDHYWKTLADNGYWPVDGGPWVYEPGKAQMMTGGAS